MNFRLIAGLIIVIVIMGTGMTILFGKYQREREDRMQAQKFAIAEERQKEFYMNKAGLETSRAEVSELSLRNLKAMQEDKLIANIKELEGVKKNLRNVEQILSVVAKYQNTFRMGARDTVVLLDSVKVDARVSHYSDSLNYVDILSLPDSTIAQLFVTVPIRGGVLWHRKWFLGRKHYKQDLYSTNPAVTITDQHLIRVRRGKR